LLSVIFVFCVSEFQSPPIKLIYAPLFPVKIRHRFSSACLSRCLVFFLSAIAPTPFAGTAQAQTVSVDFDAFGPDMGVNFSRSPGATFAGVDREPYWNVASNQPRGGGSLANPFGGPGATGRGNLTLVDSTGAPTPITVTWSGGKWGGLVVNFTNGYHAPATPNQGIFSSYISAKDTAGALTLANIPYATYDLIVYLQGAYGDGAAPAAKPQLQLTLNRGQETPLSTVATVNNDDVQSSPDVVFTEIGNSSSGEGNYVIYTGLKGARQQLSFSNPLDNREIGISGFQIVNTPAVLGQIFNSDFSKRTFVTLGWTPAGDWSMGNYGATNPGLVNNPGPVAKFPANSEAASMLIKKFDTISSPENLTLTFDAGYGQGAKDHSQSLDVMLVDADGNGYAFDVRRANEPWGAQWGTVANYAPAGAMNWAPAAIDTTQAAVADGGGLRTFTISRNARGNWTFNGAGWTGGPLAFTDTTTTCFSQVILCGASNTDDLVFGKVKLVAQPAGTGAK